MPDVWCSTNKPSLSRSTAGRRGSHSLILCVSGCFQRNSVIFQNSSGIFVRVLTSPHGVCSLLKHSPCVFNACVCNVSKVLSWGKLDLTNTQHYFAKMKVKCLNARADWVLVLPPLNDEQHFLHLRKATVQSVHLLINSLACLLFQLLYVCHVLKINQWWEKLLYTVFTVRFFYSNFVNIFVLTSTKSNFILLRFYGENVLYKWNERSGVSEQHVGYLLEE